MMASTTSALVSSRALALLAATALLLPGCHCQDTIYPWRTRASVAVLGESLYVMGGGTTQRVNTSQNDVWHEENRVFVLPLWQSWAASSVNAESATNGGWHSTDLISMWPSRDNKSIYTWGGRSYNPSQVNEWSEDPRLRAFTPDATRSPRGQWVFDGAPRPRNMTDGDRIPRTAEGSWTSCNGLGFYMGGVLRTASTDGSPADTKEMSWADGQNIPGMAIYNMTTGTWRNETARGFGTGPAAGTHKGGAAVCLSDMGTDGKGLVVFLGGSQQSSWQGDKQDAELKMDRISFYDIGTGQFHTQATTSSTGTAPMQRRWPCAVATRAGNSKTYEIVLFGGKGQSPATADVLTIPGFHWFTALSGRQTLDFERQEHACAVVGPGGRQMVAVGGTPGDKTDAVAKNRDPWREGIQVLDLTELTWSETYNHSAPAYQQHREVREWYTSGKLKDVQWIDDSTKALFANIMEKPVGDSTTSTPEGQTGSGGGGQDGGSGASQGGQGGGPATGAIAGGVVGGLAGLALIAAAVFYFCRSKRRRAAAAAPPTDAESSQDHKEPSHAHPQPPVEAAHSGSPYTAASQLGTESPTEVYSPPPELYAHEWKAGQVSPMTAVDNTKGRHEMYAEGPYEVYAGPMPGTQELPAGAPGLRRSDSEGTQKYR